MPTLRPYSIRLARGTLLMLHPPTTSVRYARMERFIDIESIGLLCAGVFMATIGWLGREVSISIAGIISLFTGGCSWIMRRFLLQRRRKQTPGMIFISD